MRLRWFAMLALALLVGAAPLAGASTKKKSPRSPQRAAMARARQSLINRNLVANGDGELEESGFASGFEPPETLQSERYGHTTGEWSGSTTSGPGSRERYLRLPVPNGLESIAVEQWISVAPESLMIDARRLEYTLSGMLGGTTDTPNAITFTVEFDDAMQGILRQVETAPVKPTDLPKPEVGWASLLHREVSGPLPAGTRRVHVTLTVTNLDWNSCPNCAVVGLADQLSLVLRRAQPKP